MPSIPAPARAVSTSKSAAAPFVSRISTARSAVMVRALSSSASATRQTCQPDGAKEESRARSSTTSGVRQRTKAMAPASPLPRSFPKASPRMIACSSVHTMFILRWALKAWPQALHRFGIVDANEQSQIAQTALQHSVVCSQKIIGNRQPGRGYVHAEAVAFSEYMDELLEGERPEAGLVAASQDVKMDNVVQDRIREHKGSDFPCSFSRHRVGLVDPPFRGEPVRPVNI